MIRPAQATMYHPSKDRILEVICMGTGSMAARRSKVGIRSWPEMLASATLALESLLGIQNPDNIP